MAQPDRRYLTSLDVRRMFGGISDMTLWRWLRNDRLDFPKPMMVNRRRLFDAAAIEAWADRQKAGEAA